MQIDSQLFFDWPYDEALEWMSKAFARVSHNPQQIIIACGSHKEQVVTLGRNLALNNLDKSKLSPNMVIRSIERGGGVTAHEPGQLVLYPVFNIEHHRLSVAELIKVVERSALDFLHKLGIEAVSFQQGIFVKDAKIGFWGLRITEGITSHGLAINLFNQAQIFDLFDPCGVKNMPITSAYRHQDLPKSIEHYAALLRDCFIDSLCTSLK